MKREIKSEARKIGRRVRELRDAKGLSRNALAKLAGMAPSTIQKIEAGESNFWVTTVARIAWALEIKVADLWPD